jgi:DNA-damage-inducible protein D
MEDINAIKEQNTIKLMDELKKISDSGKEYWLAREVQEPLGYQAWSTFQDTINRAKQSCASFGANENNHFRHITKMVALGSGASRDIGDIVLSRYACYLIAMNGDPKKPEISAAQAYFAIQTRRQELFDQLTEEQKRIVLRDRVKDSNKSLSDAAKEAGVSNYPLFQDAGYKGLYGGLGVKQLKGKKGISDKNDFLDCIGRMELAINDFRITQTEAKLTRNKISGDYAAREVHKEVGKEVRNTIEKIGGTMPENLPAEPPIKQLKRANKTKELPPSSI